MFESPTKNVEIKTPKPPTCPVDTFHKITNKILSPHGGFSMAALKPEEIGFFPDKVHNSPTKASYDAPIAVFVLETI